MARLSLAPAPPPIAVAALLLCASLAWGAKNVRDVGRAPAPKFPKNVTDAFFEDARAKLVGARPAERTAPAPGVAPTPDTPEQPIAQGGFAWSKLISSDTLEDEVKTLERQLAEAIVSPAKFKGGGFKAARLHFSVMATVFGVIGQYDQDVRWKAQAPGIRDLIARAGFNCKVGTDAAYKEAKARKDDLETLVGGGTIQTSEAERAAKWPAVASRPPLMQRLEEAHQRGLTPWTANSDEFKRNATKIKHEAQIIAALAEVIQHADYEFADDESYLNFARQLRKHAQDVAEAAEQNDYQQARTATGEIEKSCSSCHEGFRS